VRAVDAASYAREHHDYPAADIFVGCGADVVAPVDGTVLEVRRTDDWDPAEDDPATRGGRSVTLLGLDGVRYYFAHLDDITADLTPGRTVHLGDALGHIGETGRASACHLHFAISPPCPGKEWSVRRGVIEPWDYLDAWRRGEQSSPADATRRWQQDHPNACAIAMADPSAPRS
jgi:murein DD-endopeptidase MepM/ murein hydrolase activator NlpD